MTRKNIRNLLLKYMMSWFLFGDGWEQLVETKNLKTKIEWWIYETKNTYISKVAVFLEDWVKQMKKDLL